MQQCLVDITRTYVRMNKLTQEDTRFFKISVGQKVVGQTSRLAHWEQKV